MKRSSLQRIAVSAAVLLIGFGGAWAQTKPATRTTKPAAAPAEATQPKPAQIDRNGVLILIRSAILALYQANTTGNYTVLRDLGAPGFQSANTAARLAEIFASQRAQNLDLSGVLVLEPQLTQLPQILPNGLMQMAGFFPSVPLQVNFELVHAPVQGQWRLIGIAVKVGQPAPAAPSEPAPAADASAANPSVSNPSVSKPSIPPKRP